MFVQKISFPRAGLQMIASPFRCTVIRLYPRLPLDFCPAFSAPGLHTHMHPTYPGRGPGSCPGAAASFKCTQRPRHNNKWVERCTRLASPHPCFILFFFYPCEKCRQRSSIWFYRRTIKVLAGLCLWRMQFREISRKIIKDEVLE